MVGNVVWVDSVVLKCFVLKYIVLKCIVLKGGGGVIYY